MATEAPDNEMFSDRNFQDICALATKPKEFLRLIDANAPGYTVKKRIAEGLKEFVVKVESTENKLYMVKAVGKVKGKMESEDHELINKYNSLDLKEKLQSLNASVQSMIDEGKLTAEEQPLLRQQLADRRTKAKEAGKEKVVEKVELMLVSVAKAQGIVHEVKNLEAFYPLEQELKHIQRLEKLPEKNLSDDDWYTMKKKSKIQGEIEALEKKSRMWFETEKEFRDRLDKALVELAKQKAEQKKREEEEAKERKIREEEEAMERKRQAAKEAEEKKAKELEAKLESKRLEASLKPQKAAPQAKKKDKVVRTRLNPLELFQPPPRNEEEEEDEVVEQEEEEEVKEEQAPVDEAPSTPPVEPSEPAEPKPSPAKETAKPQTAPKKAAPAKAVIESKWSAPAAGEVPAELAEALGGEPTDDADAPGPSLLESMAAGTAPVKKTPPPQPKKKEKKKFTKMSVTDLGFDANNPNHRN